MSLSKDEVKKIASLSKLEINDNEIEKYILDLSNIVDMADYLKEVSVDNLVYSNEYINNFREDVVEKSLDRHDILKNSKVIENGCISLPKVVANE
ncbi:MAG: Asp-tRNA(Asn)/Glu-tRNA(Gln) amidotransferase subunit GatC [Clostridia bacterium]